MLHNLTQFDYFYLQNELSTTNTLRSVGKWSSDWRAEVPHRHLSLQYFISINNFDRGIIEFSARLHPTSQSRRPRRRDDGNYLDSMKSGYRHCRIIPFCNTCLDPSVRANRLPSEVPTDCPARVLVSCCKQPPRPKPMDVTIHVKTQECCVHVQIPINYP